MNLRKYRTAIISTIDLLQYFTVKIKRKLLFSSCLSVASAFAESVSLALLIPLLTLLLNDDIGGANGNSNRLINIISDFFPGNQALKIALVLAIFLSAYIATILIRIVNLRYTINISAEIANYLSTLSFANIANKSYSDYQNITYATISTLLTAGPGGTATYIELILNFITSLSVSSAIILFLLIYNPASTIFIVLVLTIIIYLTGISSRGVILADSRAWPALNVAKTEFMKEFHSCFKEINIRSNQDEFITKFNGLDWPLRESHAKIRYLSLSPKLILEAATIFLLIIVSGYYMMFSKNATSGLIVLSVYVLAIQKLLPQITGLYNTFLTISSQYTWFKQVKYSLDESKAKQHLNCTIKENLYSSDMGDPRASKDIVFSQLSYRLPNGNLLFENFNYEFPANSSTLIIGKSGSGKSTLLDLLLGLLVPESGSIFVNGCDLHSSALNLKSHQKSLAYVPQNIFCFNDTLAKNIVFKDKQTVDKDKIDRSCKASFLTHDFLGEPLQLEFVVGENGKRLSGGQRQRLSIARALYAESNLLVMDEPTSAIDQKTSHAIVSNITREFDGTIVMVSHDISLSRYFDTTLDLDKI